MLQTFWLSKWHGRGVVLTEKEFNFQLTLALGVKVAWTAVGAVWATCVAGHVSIAEKFS